MSTELKKILSYPANDIDKILQNGIYSVGTESEREALTLNIKTTNRTVFVRESGKTYSWNGNTWDELASGGGFDLSKLPKFINKVKVSLSSSLAGLLTLPIVSSSNFVVDWGDGTEVEEYKNATTVISHQYSNTSFTGWITIYGEWGGIHFASSSSNNNKLSLRQIIYDRNITSIPDYGLHGCYITKLEVSDDFEQFGKHSLENTYSLKEIKYPERTSRFLEYACASSMLGHIKLTLDSSWGAPKYAFQSNNSLKTVEILESGFTTVQIHNSQFRNCNQLYSVKLSRNVNKLDTYAFYGCRKLTKLEIPEGTETFTISNNAIPSVTDLTIKKEVPAVLASTNALPANLEIIRVPSSNLYSYKTGSNWSEYADKIYPIGGQYSETVTIPAANWVDNAQNVEVVGSTNETRNIIEFMLVDVNGNQIEDVYGLTATQGTTSMTFTCQTVPTEDLQVFIKSTLTNY